MKTTKIILLAILFSFSLSTQAQVAINKDGSTPATGAIFHVKGDNAGTAIQAMFIEFSTGNIDIGTTTPGFPLSFKDEQGSKISFSGLTGAHYGIGDQPDSWRIVPISPPLFATATISSYLPKFTFPAGASTTMARNTACFKNG